MQDTIKKETEYAVLIGLSAKNLTEDETSDEASLTELEQLLLAAGGVCAGRVFQTREATDAHTFIGEGKAEEVRNLVESTGAQLVVFDNKLSPSQTRALEDIFKVRVIDRSTLILDIFASRAQTREGRMQVELAQLKDLLPRLSGHGTQLSRLGGGIGTRGPGETKLETDRRHIRRRITKLEEELRQVRRVRTMERRLRQKTDIPVIALIGYTNAGKSTLLNALTGAGVQANDRLFDTLDPATRRCKIADIEVLLTDTVGFIRKLPHHLIDAFKATLEELAYADLILHVIDQSNPEWKLQEKVTEKLVAELKADKTPVLKVFNKCDLCADTDAVYERGSVCVSAATGQGLNLLLDAIVQTLDTGKRTVSLRLPYAQSSLLDMLYREAVVNSVRYDADFIEVSAVCQTKLLYRLRPYYSDEAPDEDE